MPAPLVRPRAALRSIFLEDKFGRKTQEDGAYQDNMKENRIMADPEKFGVALATCLVSGFLAWKGFQLGRPAAGIVFTVILLIFAYIVFLYGCVLKVSSDGVQKVFLFIPLKFLTWDEIAEIGVIGTKIFNGGFFKKKPGRRYIYISEKEMDGDSRFKMALEWPPHGSIMYCIYNKENFDTFQFRWSNTIVKYNAGDSFED